MSQGTLQKTIPAYLYKQYQDDENVQAFVDAYNNYTQQFVNFFNTLQLPIYPTLSGPLLDWCAEGIYGYARPVISEGQIYQTGELNTFELNSLDIDGSGTTGTEAFVATSDDIYQRCLTWHIYKGDGRNFSVPWLKRRIMRFLNGTNGKDYNIDQTYQVSVTFGAGNQVNINLVSGMTYMLKDSSPDTFEFNTMEFNGYSTIQTTFAGFQYGQIFIDAVNCGALEMPFQYDFVVQQGQIGVAGYYNSQGNVAPFGKFVLGYNVFA